MEKNSPLNPSASGPLNSQKIGEFTDYYEKLGAKRREERVNPLDFRGNPKFPDTEIVADMTKAQQAVEDFKKKDADLTPEEQIAKANGSITETVLCQNIEAGNMFGKDAHLEIASEFDDFFNHIDAFVIAGVEEDEKPDGTRRNTFGLAFDFTSKAEDACEKLRMTLEHTIMKGWAPSVKYGKTPDGTQVRNMWVAKVIIGADREAVKDLADLLVNKTGQDTSKPVNEIVLNAFEQHRIKNIITDEILNQLVAFRNIAYAIAGEIRNDDPDPNRRNKKQHLESVAKMYHRAYAMFSKILEKNDFDPHKAEVDRKGDKIASALHGMIAKAADPNKKMKLSEYIADYLANTKKRR